MSDTKEILEQIHVILEDQNRQLMEVKRIVMSLATQEQVDEHGQEIRSLKERVRGLEGPEPTPA
jgi:hypothetical protein